MKSFKALFACALVLLAAPVLAQPAQWSTAATTHGTVTAQLPCSEEAVEVRERDGLEAIRCDYSGLINFLFVMREEMLAKFNFPGASIPELREKIEADGATEYLKDTSIDGFDGFYSEGKSSSGKVALGVIDLRDGRYVMLNVQSDGSAEAEELISEVFTRTWGSVKMVTP